jgi:hypothetical protein
MWEISLIRKCQGLCYGDCIRHESQDKHDARSEKCILVCVPQKSFGYMFYRPSENEVFVARREFFTVRELLSKEDSGSTIDLEEIQEVKDEESIVDTSMRYEAESEEPVV